MIQEKSFFNDFIHMSARYTVCAFSASLAPLTSLYYLTRSIDRLSPINPSLSTRLLVITAGGLVLIPP